MNPVEEVTQETLEAIKGSTAGILNSSGMTGVDLIRRVSLVPANVPARNNTAAFPRTNAPMGSNTATWRAWLNVNSGQSDAAVGYDFAGSLVNFSAQNVFAPYVPLAKAGRVTLDSVAIGKGFYDALADAELMTLIQLFIMQDLHIINGQAWGLGTAATPTLTAASTGGSIAQSTAVHVKVAVRSGANYFLGGNSIASSDATLTTSSVSASTYSVTASIPAQAGAVAYDWFVGSSSSNQVYYTTTTVASVLITSVITAAQALPTLPLLSTTVPTILTADASFSANWYNGVIASTLGDYGTTGPVKPGGSGTPTGATFIDNGGNAPALSGGGIDILDKLNDNIWASTQLSPTAYMMNSLQGDEISKLILGTSSATTFLPPTDADARTNLAGGGFIGRYVNRAAGGVPVSIEVHPRVAPGTIIARTDRVPFPGSNIGTVFEVRCLYDTRRFDYAASYTASVVGGGPRYDFEIRSLESLINYAPGAQAIASNVA